MAVSSAEAIAEVGITYRQLSYWRQRGWITPVDADQRGSGHPVEWSADQLNVMRRLALASDVAKVLLDKGLPAFADALDEWCELMGGTS